MGLVWTGNVAGMDWECGWYELGMRLIWTGNGAGMEWK